MDFFTDLGIFLFPTLLLLCGLLMWIAGKPQRINWLVGYRMPRAMENQDTWVLGAQGVAFIFTEMTLRNELDKNGSRKRYLKTKWLQCPICNSKIWARIRDDPMLENIPLSCPRYRNEALVDVC